MKGICELVLHDQTRIRLGEFPYAEKGGPEQAAKKCAATLKGLLRRQSSSWNLEVRAAGATYTYNRAQLGF